MSRFRIVVFALLLVLAALSLIRAGRPVTDGTAVDRTAARGSRAAEPDRELVAARRALEITERKLGPDHPDLVPLLQKLAAIHITRGAYGPADSLCRRLLAIQERALVIRQKTVGPDHLDVATMLGNLARVYDIRGEYARAESLYVRVLAIEEKALGPDHPSVAMICEDLELFRRTTAGTRRAGEAATSIGPGNRRPAAATREAPAGGPGASPDQDGRHRSSSQGGEGDPP